MIRAHPAGVRTARRQDSWSDFDMSDPIPGHAPSHRLPNTHVWRNDPGWREFMWAMVDANLAKQEAYRPFFQAGDTHSPEAAAAYDSMEFYQRMGETMHALVDAHDHLVSHAGTAEELARYDALRRDFDSYYDLLTPQASIRSASSSSSSAALPTSVRSPASSVSARSGSFRSARSASTSATGSGSFRSARSTPTTSADPAAQRRVNTRKKPARRRVNPQGRGCR